MYDTNRKQELDYSFIFKDFLYKLYKLFDSLKLEKYTMFSIQKKIKG